MEEVKSDSKAADSKEADAISCPQDMRCASVCVRAGVCARMRLVLQCGRRGPEKSQNKHSVYSFFKKETCNNKSPEIIQKHKNMPNKRRPGIPNPT